MAGTNLAYSLDKDGNVQRRVMTKEELETAREKAQSAELSLRSCWVCNSAHERFLNNLEDNFFFCCAWGCGRYYFNGMDITEDESDE